MKKLIIFDCDGVLVDSEVIANRINAEMLTELGYIISTEDSIKKFTGMNDTTVKDFIFQESGIRVPDNFFELIKQRTLNTFNNELKPLVYGVLEHCYHMLKCVASLSSQMRVLKSLELTKQDKTVFFQKNLFLRFLK